MSPDNDDFSSPFANDRETSHPDSNNFHFPPQRILCVQAGPTFHFPPYMMLRSSGVHLTASALPVIAHPDPTVPAALEIHHV
jgi:hypothetical protein